MTSRAFSCKTTFIRKNLSQFWLLSVAIGVVLSLIAYMAFQDIPPYIGRLPSTAALFAFEEINRFLKIPLELIASLIIAPCVFFYLHQKKGNHFYQTLPINRDHLFLHSLLSGLLLYLIPWLMVFGTSTPMLFSAAKGYSLLIEIYCRHFLLRLALFVICYSIAVLGSVLCYRGVLASFLGLLLHIVFLAIEVPFLPFSDHFFYGIPTPNVFFSLPLSPYFYLITRASIPLGVLGLYTAVAVGLTVLSFYLNRWRKDDQVGTSVLLPGARHPFIWIIITWIICSPLTLLTGISELLFRPSTAVPILLLLSFVLGLPIFLLLHRISFQTKTLFDKKAFLQYGIYFLCSLTVVLSLHFDLFGLVRKVPDAGQVTSATLYLEGVEFTTQEPDDIRTFVEIHKEILAERKTSADQISDSSFGTYAYGFDLTYTMTGGRTLCREYVIYHSSVPYQMLTGYLLQGEPGARFLKELNGQSFDDISLSCKEDDTSAYLSGKELNSLFSAMEQDASEGNYPLTGATTPYKINFSKLVKSHATYMIDLPLYISENATHTVALCQEFLFSK